MDTPTPTPEMVTLAMPLDALVDLADMARSYAQMVGRINERPDVAGKMAERVTHAQNMSDTLAKLLVQAGRSTPTPGVFA